MKQNQKIKDNILNNNIIMIICTMPNENKHTAVSIAKTLITNKLAACVNIISNVNSIYYWENNIQEKNEIQLLIKTCKKLEQSVFEQIKIQHPHQTPELLTFKIDNGEKNYLSWIYSSLN